MITAQQFSNQKPAICPDDAEPVILAYNGLFQATDHKEYHYYFCLRTDGSLDENNTVSTKKPLIAGVQPGTLIFAWVTKTEGKVTSIYNQDRQVVGVFHDRERVAKWQASHKLYQTQKAQRAKEKKIAEHTEFFDSLDIARRAYRLAAPKDRAAMLAIIIEYVTR